jgi:hypothetical protein
MHPTVHPQGQNCQNRQNSPQDPLPAVSAIGASQWAATLGVDADNTFALAATILAGVAAPFAYLQFPWGLVLVPKCHTVVPDKQGTLRHILDHLLSPARRTNSQIVANMAGVNPAMLRHLIHGSFAGDPNKANPQAPFESMALQTLRENQIFDPHGSRVPSGEGDAIPDPKLCRLEGIQRPSVLLMNPAIARLEKLLQGCHQSHALAADMSFAPLATSARPAKEVATLLTFMQGTEIEIPQPKHPVSIEHARTAGIQSIFSADPILLSRLLPLLSPVLEECLLLSNTSPDFKILPGSSNFATWYSDAISRTITRRRNSFAMVESFSSPAAVCQFQERFVAHQSACDACDFTVGQSARNLPMTLVWFLLTLRRHLRDRTRPSDEAVVESVFSASANLLERHRRAMSDLHNAAQRDEFLKRVRDVVRKVAEKQLVTESQLARSFDNQRIGLYRPIVQLLVEESVLSTTQEGKLCIGSRSLDDALPKLLLTSVPPP